MYISVPIAPDKPVDHLLQLHPEGGAPGQEDHPAGLLLLLHPRQDDAGEGLSLSEHLIHKEAKWRRGVMLDTLAKGVWLLSYNMKTGRNRIR